MSNMLEKNVQDISVIICAYTEKRWDQLVAAVNSVKQQTVQPREIIVVIDHNDALLEKANAFPPTITVIENSEAQGLSGARNQGIALAQSALIAFLDDDATAEPDWLERLIRHCQDTQVLGAGGSAEPLWSSPQPSWFPEEFFWVVGCKYRGLPQTLSIVRNPYGGCMCFRREVFEAVGGFRNGIGRIGSRPLGGEETELCIRIHQHWPSRHFFYDPLARIHHHIPPQRASWRYFCARCHAEGCSKALISRYAGTKDSLATEKIYLCSTLPSGILHGLADACLRLDLTGLLRSGAILIGLLLTLLGYLTTLLNRPKTRSRQRDPNTHTPLSAIPAHNYHRTKSG